MLACATNLLASQKELIKILRQNDGIVTEIFQPAHLGGCHRLQSLGDVSDSNRDAIAASEVRLLQISLKGDGNRVAFRVKNSKLFGCERFRWQRDGFGTVVQCFNSR